MSPGSKNNIRLAFDRLFFSSLVNKEESSSRVQRFGWLALGQQEFPFGGSFAARRHLMRWTGRGRPCLLQQTRPMTSNPTSGRAGWGVGVVGVVVRFGFLHEPGWSRGWCRLKRKYESSFIQQQINVLLLLLLLYCWFYLQGFTRRGNSDARKRNDRLFVNRREQFSF